MAEKQTMLINEKKLSMMNPEHRKLLEQEMVNFLFEGKDVHIEGYTPPENNNAQLLPGGAALARAYGYVGRVSAAPPGNSNPKANTTRTPGMMKNF